MGASWIVGARVIGAFVGAIVGPGERYHGNDDGEINSPRGRRNDVEMWCKGNKANPEG